MSIKIMAGVWELPIPANEKMVLLSLADQAGDDGICWPSIPMIARRCSRSEREVHYCLDRLEEMGHLTRKRRFGRSTIFTIKTQVESNSETNSTHATYAVPEPQNNEAPLQPVQNTSANCAVSPLQPVQFTPATCADRNQRKPNKKPKETKHRDHDAKRPTKISPTFEPNLTGIALAADLAIPIERELPKFIDYWTAKGTARADWNATFRNWIRNAAEYRARDDSREADRRKGPASVVDAALRARAINAQRGG